VLELGFFIGKLGRPNTVLLVDETESDDIEYPSDLGGIIPISYRRGSDWKMRLMSELKAAKIKHKPENAY
jgi:predicted nucleotide-binding protein